MSQRRPETRLCPLMSAKECLATKCMMYYEVPNSSVALCQLSSVNGLADIVRRQSDLATKVTELQQRLQQIETRPQK